MIETIALMVKVLTPIARRGFPRYWISISNGRPVGRFGNLPGGLGRIDAAFGPSLQVDADALCADMLGAPAVDSEAPRRDGDETATSGVRNARARPVEVAGDIHFELLLRVRKSTPHRRDIAVYKLRDIPGDILPDWKRAKSPRNRRPVN